MQKHEMALDEGWKKRTKKIEKNEKRPKKKINLKKREIMERQNHQSGDEKFSA